MPLEVLIGLRSQPTENGWCQYNSIGSQPGSDIDHMAKRSKCLLSRVPIGHQSKNSLFALPLNKARKSTEIRESHQQIAALRDLDSI